jgi:hypothetical protein
LKIYVAAVEALRKKTKEKMKLSLPPKISAFNAQGSRGIIVAVQVGAVENPCT